MVWTVHLGVRLAAESTGAGLRTRSLDFAWQLLDLSVLRSDPWGGIARLHIQPPLYNAAIAAALASPFPLGGTLRVIGLLLGLVLVTCVWWLARRWTRSDAAAAIIAVLVSLHPSSLLAEYQPSYELGIMTLLALVVVLVEGLRHGEVAASPEPDRRWVGVQAMLCSPVGRGFGIGAVLGAVVMTRSLFHPLWALVVLIVLGRRHRRVALAAAAVFLVLVGPWVVRTEVMFDRAGLSSWFGMNLQRVAVNPLTPEQHASMAAVGRRSPVTDRPEFASLDSYPSAAECAAAAPPDRHPALADAVKSTTTNVILPNFNHHCYLALYDAAGADARHAIVDHPDAYARGVGAAVRFYLAAQPAADAADSPVVRALDRVWRVVLIAPDLRIDLHRWVFPLATLPAVVVPFSWVLAVAVPVAAAAGLRAPVARRRGSGGVTGTSMPGTSMPGTAMLVASVTVAWCTLVGVLAESGENARFRMMVDPLVTLLVLTTLLRCGRFVAARVRGRRGSGGTT